MTRFQPETENNQVATAETPNDVLVVQDDGGLKANELALRESPKVMALANSLDVNDQNAIVEFGSQPAQQVSQFADRILATVKKSAVQDSGRMLKDLSEILKNFDRKDFEEGKGGVLSGLFHKGKDAIQRMLDKYQTVGHQIDKVTNEIVTYKNTLNQANVTLDEMFKQNFQYHEELLNYIVAGEMVIEELEAQDLPAFQQKAQSGKTEDINALQQLQDAIDLLKDRVVNLRGALVASEQAAPEIRMTQKGNYGVILRIHSAFIVTLPIFKNSLVEMVILKQQKIASDGMKAFEDVSNQMLVEAARRSSQQAKEIAMMNSKPVVSLDALEERQRIILQGIEDVRQIEAQKAKDQQDSAARLGRLSAEMATKMKTYATR